MRSQWTKKGTVMREAGVVVIRLPEQLHIAVHLWRWTWWLDLWGEE